MNVLKDRKIIILGAILFVFTILYFIVVNHVSYAFETTIDSEATYATVIDTIKKSASAYGKDKPQLFSENNTAYIKVQDLIDEKYLITDESGSIPNPLNDNETLNSKMVKIKLENEELLVEVDK